VNLLPQPADLDVPVLDLQFVAIVQLERDLAAHSRTVRAVRRIIQKTFSIEIGYGRAIQPGLDAGASTEDPQDVPAAGVPGSSPGCLRGLDFPIRQRGKNSS